MTDTTAAADDTRSLPAPEWRCVQRGLLLLLFASATGIVFAHGQAGSIFGVVSAIAVMAYAWLERDRLKNRSAGALILAEMLSLLSMTIDPGPLNITLAWIFAAMLALLVHGDRLENLAATLLRTMWLGMSALPLGLLDGIRLAASPQWHEVRSGLKLERAALPLIASLTLILLLAAANPLIEHAFEYLSLDWLADFVFSNAGAAFLLALLLVWPLLSMWPGVLAIAAGPVMETAPRWHARYLSPASVLVTLLLLNAMLGLQNLLDLIFMWSGEALPEGMTYAEYAHRGAYPLIATALLAGALVIVALWPGTATAAQPSIRWLVYVWMAQNVFLVASTIDRTLAYVDVYGMTELRLAALIWMGLVAWGLILIVARIARHCSNQWLINANVISAAVLLLASSFLDHKAFVADWNVDTAIARLGTISAFDRHYLHQLGIPALPAVRRLEQAIAGKPPGTVGSDWLFLLPAIRTDITDLEIRLQAQQTDWRRWNLRHSRITQPMALSATNR